VNLHEQAFQLTESYRSLVESRKDDDELQLTIQSSIMAVGAASSFLRRQCKSLLWYQKQETMKTRFNVFNQIHKALRALMFDTALIMQQTDFANSAEAAAILQQTQMTLDLMDSHACHEDEFILSAAAKYAPEVIAAFESEHVTDLRLTNELRGLLVAYHAATSAEERQDTGCAILQAFNEFIAFNLSHMRKEETVLNEILWANYSDAEILQMEIRIQQQIAPDQVFIYFKWMVKGINDPELLEWLRTVRNGAPEFVFTGLWQLCQQELSTVRWQRLSSQLAEGALCI
jgi:hypothetical protein